MKKFFCIFPLFAVLLMTACEEELPETMGGIYGIVSNSETGEPVRGASVILSPGNQTTVTGYDGHFEFSNLAAGQYKLQASASGYNTNSRQITVVAGKDASGDMPLSPIAEVMNVRLSNNYFDFGSSHSELALTIQNTGNSGSIDWIITGVDATWLTVSPLSGSIAMGKTADVKLVVDRSKLATDEASTTFMVNAAGGSQSVRVNVSKKTAGGSTDDDDNNNNSGAQDVTGGLYAYYTFEENMKNQIEDGAPNATAVNAPTYVDGMNGTKAIKFNVNDNSFMSISEAMIHYGTFSVSFWVRNLGDGHIFHIEKGDRCRYAFGMKSGFFNVYLASHGGFSVYEGNAFAHEAIDYSSFTMVTLTSSYGEYGAHELKLYLNGELVDLCSLKSYPEEYEKFIFGGKLGEAWHTSNMIVDNLRIYDTRALNAQEVERIYNYEKE